MFRLKFGQTLILLSVILVQTITLLYLLKSFQSYSNIHDLILKNENKKTQSNYETNLKYLRNIDVTHASKATGPIVYVVTPTYRRATQRADITRLGQTLRNLDFIFWIVVEDGEKTYPDIANTLTASEVPFVYLSAPVPEEYRHTKHLGRGVFNRRAALDWLRRERKDGVLYFADDDNTYALSIFEQIQETRRISVFPVGMVQQFGVSSPMVRDGRVFGFHDAFQGGRTFAMDMAGFAVNLSLLHANPEATILMYVSTLEDGFLKELGVKMEDLEPLANGCTEVLVWHTRTQTPKTPDKKNIPADSVGSNLQKLYDNIT